MPRTLIHPFSTCLPGFVQPERPFFIIKLHTIDDPIIKKNSTGKYMKLRTVEATSHGISGNNSCKGKCVKITSAIIPNSRNVPKNSANLVILILYAFNIARPLNKHPRPRPNNAPVFLALARVKILGLSIGILIQGPIRHLLNNF